MLDYHRLSQLDNNKADRYATGCAKYPHWGMAQDILTDQKKKKSKKKKKDRPGNWGYDVPLIPPRSPFRLRKSTLFTQTPRPWRPPQTDHTVRQNKHRHKHETKSLPLSARKPRERTNTPAPSLAPSPHPPSICFAPSRHVRSNYACRCEPSRDCHKMIPRVPTSNECHTARARAQRLPKNGHVANARSCPQKTNIENKQNIRVNKRSSRLTRHMTSNRATGGRVITPCAAAKCIPHDTKVLQCKQQVYFFSKVWVRL